MHLSHNKHLHNVQKAPHFLMLPMQKWYLFQIVPPLFFQHLHLIFSQSHLPYRLGFVSLFMFHKSNERKNQSYNLKLSFATSNLSTWFYFIVPFVYFSVIVFLTHTKREWNIICPLPIFYIIHYFIPYYNQIRKTTLIYDTAPRSEIACGNKQKRLY